jgi:FkbM family methyltransferase
MKPPVPQAGFCALLGLYQPAVVCDIGSLNGHQAIGFKRVCPDAEVIAFEANPRNYEAMLADERIRDAGVSVVNLAVSDHSGPVEFNVVEVPEDRPWASGTSSLMERRSEHALDSVKVSVEATRLDEYLGDREGSVALWIDVEGALDRVIAGLDGIADRVVLIHLEAEDIPVWEGQATWSEVEQQLARDFEVVGSLRESDSQRNHLLLRRGATRQRSVRLVLSLTRLPGAGRAWAPRSPGSWYGFAGPIFSRLLRGLPGRGESNPARS